MKKFLFFGILLCVVVSTDQKDVTDRLINKKGTWNLTGDFSLGINNNESENEDSFSTNDSRSINFRSAVGHTVSDNLIVGLGFGYGRRTQDLDFSANDGAFNNTENTTNTYSVFPYVKKFFGLSKSLAFFIQGEVRYDRSELEQETMNVGQFNRDNNTDSLFVGIRPGMTFFVSKKFAFETNFGSLGYSRFSSEANNGDLDSSSTGNSFNFDFNPSNLFFGLSYYF
ncbi:MAG: hypothetical protein ACFB0A_06015 [Croceivirga sp.]